MPEEETEAAEQETKKTPQEGAGKTTKLSSQTVGALFSPEGIIMMFVAGILDLTGLILLIFGLDDFGITDIIGIVVIGGWMFSKSGLVAAPKGAEKTTQGAIRKLFRGKGKWKKFLVPIIGEAIPYFGGIAFCWTLAVYFELTS